MKELYNLKPFEYYKISTNQFMTRVPWGWIYESYSEEWGMTSSFIPFNIEFKDIWNELKK